MSKQIDNSAKHDEIVSLLPWFVNQTLDNHQKQAVLSHIDNCVECQNEIHFLESLNGTLKNDAQNSHSMRADVSKDFANVMNRIDANSQRTNAVVSMPSFILSKLGNLFKFATALPVPQWSATALAGLLAAVLGFQFYYAQSDNDYSVLSSSNIGDAAMRLSVEFAPAVNLGQAQTIIQGELEKLEQQADIDTTKDGMYTIVFKESIDVNELSNLILILENKVQIKRVEILH